MSFNFISLSLNTVDPPLTLLDDVNLDLLASQKPDGNLERVGHHSSD